MQTPTQSATIESELWGRLFPPGDSALTQESAQLILSIDFPESDKQRMNDLAAKARRGSLTPTEQYEIDAYGRVGSFISIMKSKVRAALKKSPYPSA